MDWQPITDNELSLLIEEAILELSEEARLKFESVRTPISKVRCKRFDSDQYGEELLFVIGRSGNKLLVFDDVEDDFGIADLAAHGDTPLENWRLFGTLEYALLGL